jgi:hypothetical protein
MVASAVEGVKARFLDRSESLDPPRFLAYSQLLDSAAGGPVWRSPAGVGSPGISGSEEPGAPAGPRREKHEEHEEGRE